MGAKQDALGDLLGALDVLRQCLSVIDGSIKVIIEGSEYAGTQPSPVMCENCKSKVSNTEQCGN